MHNLIYTPTPVIQTYSTMSACNLFFNKKNNCLSATANESIFIKPGPNETLYKLKNGIRFHLYINTAPCGDARIFSPHEDDMAVDKHPNR